MEEEILELSRNNGWNSLYADIRRDSSQHDFSALEASRPENRCLNRYRDVYPYDHSRVVLRDHHVDYINASLVKGPESANRAYILAQGPLPTTVGHFWLTVWQEKSKAVLMLNRVMEKGQIKCHQYWPQNPDEEMYFEDVGIRLKNVQSSPGDHYTVRTLQLSKDPDEEGGENESRDILHFHYTTWPDFGVPQCPDTFLEFLDAVRNSGSLDLDKCGPPVVHCSAGIGRSGTFCLVDTCLVLLAKEGQAKVSAKAVLLGLRRYRMGLIQTPDQLKFSYLAIAAGAAKEGLIAPEVMERLGEHNNGGVHEAEDSEEDDSDDDKPPPLPPPRSESLKMQQEMLLDQILAQFNSHQGGGDGNLLNVHNAAEIQINGNGEHSSSSEQPSPEYDLLKKRISPQLSSSSASSEKTSKTDSSSPNKCILNNHKMEERKREMELRRRKKEEQNAAMESRIEEMRRKAKEADERHSRRNWLYDRLLLPGAALGAAAAVAASYYFYFYSAKSIAPDLPPPT